MLRLGSHRISGITGILLTLIVSVTIGNRILFTHIHVLPDGTHVTHAHPFNQTGDQPTQQEQHTHTSAELFFILAMDTLFLVLSALIFMAMVLSTRQLTGRSRQGVRSYCLHFKPQRAPPMAA